jgi:hypothetical protein
VPVGYLQVETSVSLTGAVAIFKTNTAEIMRAPDPTSDTAISRELLNHILSSGGTSIERDPESLLVSDALKLIRSRWELAIGSIPHVSAEGRWCVREGGEVHGVEGYTVRINGLRWPVTLYAQQDIESGYFIFACECLGESQWLPPQRIDNLRKETVDQIFADLLDWWGPKVA